MSDNLYKILPANVRTVKYLNQIRLATKNLTPHIRVYSERLITIDGIEYRLWSPHRSKLSAMIEKGMSIPLKEDSRILYLGAASGTTVSHVSDIVDNGRVFAVEFSPRAVHDLLDVSRQRRNMVPIFADAARPELYKAIAGSVDVIYQDVAQPNQAEIALANAREFLIPEGYLIMSIKARSINSAISPKKVYENELTKLETEFEVLDKKVLKPFHQDHLALIARKKFKNQN